MGQFAGPVIGMLIAATIIACGSASSTSKHTPEQQQPAPCMTGMVMAGCQP